MIAGICGGMGEVYEIDPTLIRLGIVFLGLVTGIVPIVVAHILGAIVIPLRPISKDSGNQAKPKRITNRLRVNCGVVFVPTRREDALCRGERTYVNPGAEL